VVKSDVVLNNANDNPIAIVVSSARLTQQNVPWVDNAIGLEEQVLGHRDKVFIDAISKFGVERTVEVMWGFVVDEHLKLNIHRP
jgi:hypothetical protein